MGTAAQRWAGFLAEWAIPDHIRVQARADPWQLTPRMFPADRSRVAVGSRARLRAAEVLPGGGSVLDVGAGRGAAGLALVPPAALLTAVDVSEEMLAALSATATERGVVHRTVHGQWPDVAPQVEPADVVVSHHVVYNVADIVPFVRALTDHARRRVVLEFGDRHPTSGTNPLWKHFWDLDRPERPTGDDLLEVLAEAGLDAAVERETREPRVRGPERAGEGGADRGGDVWLESITRRLCLPAERKQEVEEALARMPEAGPREAIIAWWEGSAS